MIQNTKTQRLFILLRIVLGYSNVIMFLGNINVNFVEFRRTWNFQDLTNILLFVNMFIMTLNVILNYVPLKKKVILFLGNIKILSLVFPSFTYSCFVYKYVAILTLRDF